MDSEERDKARIEAVLAGELPPSALEPEPEPEPGATASALNGSTGGEKKGDTPATEATTQGIKVGHLRKYATKFNTWKQKYLNL